MQRRRRINPIDDAKYYVQSGRDKGGLDIQYINACKGRGLFTSTSFTKGDFVCEYRGELISQQECKRRQRLYHEHLKVFMFEFKYNGKLWCIDASKEDGSYGRLVNDNHINPNTKIKYITVQGKPHLCLFANQDINPREEITYNYGDSEWPWRSNTITTSNRIETPAIELNENSPAVGPVASVRKSVDEEMPQKVSGDSNPPPTVKDFEETITTSNRIETPAIELNENSPAVGPVASVRKMGQSCSKRPPSEEPSNSDTCVTIQKCRHRLVCTSVSSLDKCIHCVGPVSSFKWLGYKCTVCSGVWHKSCLRRAENRSLEDLLHEQHLSKSSGSSSEDELQDPQSEHNSITHDDQCSTDEEYIPDSESEDDFNSDASVPRIPSLSKTGLTQTKAPIPNADVKLATEPGMSKTELWPPLDEHIVPSAAETADSATSIQQTKDGAHILTSKPVTTSNINYCYVCGKAQTKIARHLRTHKTHTEIEHIFSLPKKSKERKTLLEKLRNRGNFKHNNAVLQSGRGSLKIKRKTKSDRPAETFIHCMYCKGLYVRKELWRHARRCPDKPDDNGADNESGKRRVLGLAAAVDSVSFQKISSGVWKLISNMKDDDVASVVRNDVCILQFAQSLFNRHGQDPTKYEYMRQKLREVGRLLLCLRNDFSVHNMEDAIKPGNFQKVVQGVKKVSGYNEEQHSYQTPSLALKLGHTLKKISEIVHCRALVAEDENLAKSTETFNKLYKSKWSELVSHSALNTLSDAKYNKPSTLPFTEDVQILHQYLGKTAESAFCNLKEKATTQNYSDLAKVTLAQVVFNRRRAGEVSKMRIRSFIERDQTKLHEDVAMGLSKTEQKLCKYFTRLEIMGKRGRKVAVLLTPSMVDALSLLTSKRSECGVCDKNIFLFARPKSMSHYRGQDCLRVHASQCGAKHPEHLRSTQLRKHVATLSQVLNLKNNELDQVADFMGHDLHVHREFYRLPVPTTQLAKISKLLLSMEKGQLSSMQGKSLDEIEVEMSLSEAENSTSESEFDDGSTGAATLSGCGPTRPVDSASDSTIRDQDDKTRGVAEPSVSSTVNETVSAPEEDDVAPHNPKRTAKRAWSNAEITAIMRYFKGHIAKGKLATKNECAQCKLAEGSVLEQRTVQNIRDFVRNRGISAKRQSQKYKP